MEAGDRFEIDASAAAATAFHQHVRVAAAEFVQQCIEARDVLHFRDAHATGGGASYRDAAVLTVHRFALGLDVIVDLRQELLSGLRITQVAHHIRREYTPKATPALPRASASGQSAGNRSLQ